MMPRRFQFNLKFLFAIMTAVAVACAIFIRLPLAIRLAIGGLALSVFFWLAEGVIDWRGLLDAIVRGGSRKSYIVKHRTNASDEADRKD